MSLALPENAVLQERYRIAVVLQTSDEGSVYLALDEKAPEAAAPVKVVVKEFVVPNDLPDRERRAGVLFDALEYLEGRSHPNLAHVLDMFSEGERAYVVFEHIPGDTLQAWCTMDKVRLTETQVYDWSLQLVDALTGLHDHDPPYIFGDLDASHVIVGPGGQLKLVGFGLRRIFRREGDGRAPSLFSTLRDAVMGDIRAVGRIIVTLMSRVEEVSQDIWAFPNPSRMGLHRIISRCLSHEQDFAYKRMREILDDLCHIDRTRAAPLPPRRSSADAGERWWEPVFGKGVLPANERTTGRLHFVSTPRRHRLSPYLLAVFFACVVLGALALALPRIAARREAAYTRSGPVVYACLPPQANGVPARLTACSTTELRPVHQIDLPAAVQRFAAGGDIALLAAANQVLVLNTRNDTLEQTVPVDSGVQDVALNADGTQGFVLTRGAVSRLDHVSGVIAQLAPVEPANKGLLALSPDGETLVVANPVARRLTFLHTSDGKAAGEVALKRAPYLIAFTPDGASLWVAYAGVGMLARIATAEQQVRQEIALASRSPVQAMAISRDGGHLFLGLKKTRTLAVVDAAASRELGALPLPGVPGGLAAVTGGQAWVSIWGSAEIHAIDAARLQEVGVTRLAGPPRGLFFVP